MDENIVWGACRRQHFQSGAMQIESPSQASRAAEACAAECRPRELLLGRTASTVACAMWHAAAAGLMAQGVQLIDAGVCSLPQLRHAQRGLHAQAAMLVEDARLTPLDETGARLSERRQRAVLKLYERQDFAGPFTGITRPVQAAGGGDMAYIAGAAALLQGDVSQIPAVVLCAQPSHLRMLAEAAFVRAGLQVRCEWDAANVLLAPGEIGIYLSDSGERFTIADDSGMLEEAYLQLLLAWTALQMGETRLVLPASATRAIKPIAPHAEYLAAEPAVWMRTLAQDAPVQFMLQFDGICAALCVLSALNIAGMPLRDWKQTMPQVHRASGSVDLHAGDCGRILRSLAERSTHAETGGGLRLEMNQGWAFFCPDEISGLRIIAEAARTETAQEIFDFCKSELHALLKEK